MPEQCGWFEIDGLQEGERALEEQMIGLSSALLSAAGKTVLDLGCAEGLISREFARAGARSVTGVDAVERYVSEAFRQCAQLPCEFVLAHIEDLAAQPVKKRFDVVLALSVLHKLFSPEHGLRFAAESCAEVLVLRLPGYEESRDGILVSKFVDVKCNVAEVLESCGMTLHEQCDGPRLEPVQYWVRR